MAKEKVTDMKEDEEISSESSDVKSISLNKKHGVYMQSEVVDMLTKLGYTVELV